MKKIIHQFTETGEVRELQKDEYGLRTYERDGVFNEILYQHSNHYYAEKFTILTYERIIEEWKPTNEDYIFFINAKMEIEDHYRAFHYTNEYLECLIKANNCFPTKELAEEKLKQIKDILKGVTQ